jgi:hypothetical protein
VTDTKLWDSTMHSAGRSFRRLTGCLIVLNGMRALRQWVLRNRVRLPPHSCLHRWQSERCVAYPSCRNFVVGRYEEPILRRRILRNSSKSNEGLRSTKHSWSLSEVPSSWLLRFLCNASAPIDMQQFWVRLAVGHEQESSWTFLVPGLHNSCP